MRIDDENKVVWCNVVELKWYDSFGDRSPVKLSNRIRRLSDWGWGIGLLDYHGRDVRQYDEYNDDIVVFNDNNNRLMLNLTKALCDNYEFKLEQPKKYYWRKKKEHLACFENIVATYLHENSEGSLHLDCLMFALKATEQEARELLKDDFDMFEKVEVD